MLTETALQSFHDSGYLKLNNVVPADALEQMRARVWQLMSEQGLDRENPASWTSVNEYFGIRGVQKLQELREGETDPEVYPPVKEALDAVFGHLPRQNARHWGQVLVTLQSSQSSWLLPGSIWHFDHFHRLSGEISGVNLFLLMDEVLPGGGGTVALHNSPQLVARYLATNPKLTSLGNLNKDFLKFDPWLAGLKCAFDALTESRNRQYMADDTLVGDVPVRIVELTGCAGDVYMTHPALLHAPAMNVLARPRMMRTQRVFAVPDVE
jgi:hypothetical protein